MSVQKGNIKTTIKLQINDQDGDALDVSTASTKEIILRDPNGVSTTFDAAFTTDGSDGLIEYETTDADDLGVAGPWQAQGHVILSAGDDLKSTIDRFAVGENL